VADEAEDRIVRAAGKPFMRHRLLIDSGWKVQPFGGAPPAKLGQSTTRIFRHGLIVATSCQLKESILGLLEIS
jgi:hypothetical protein